MLKTLFAFIILISGCSSHFESTHQINDSAFLQLEGNFLNTKLILNNKDTIDLTAESIETFTLNGRKVARFPISTGKHTIKITRDGSVVVSRVIFVSNSNTFEVIIP